MQESFSMTSSKETLTNPVEALYEKINEVKQLGNGIHTKNDVTFSIDPENVTVKYNNQLLTFGVGIMPSTGALQGVSISGNFAGNDVNMRVGVNNSNEEKNAIVGKCTSFLEDALTQYHDGGKSSTPATEQNKEPGHKEREEVSDELIGNHSAVVLTLNSIWDKITNGSITLKDGTIIKKLNGSYRSISVTINGDTTNYHLSRDRGITIEKQGTQYVKVVMKQSEINSDSMVWKIDQDKSRPQDMKNLNAMLINELADLGIIEVEINRQ